MNIFHQNKTMKKGKIIVTVTIGFVFLILTMLIFMQVKAISQTDISELEIMRESELKTELTSLKTKYEETAIKIKEINEKILEYEEAAIEGKEASMLLQKELKETNDLLGRNSVTGEGIVIKMSNTVTNRVNTEDLLELVNLLKNAGAEAISINEQRIVYDSYIADLTDENYITVKGQRITAPYTIKAIGDSTKLESTLLGNGGYVEELRNYGFKVDITKELSAKISQEVYS